MLKLFMFSMLKTLCHQRVLKRHQLAVFRRAPVIFQVAKNALVVIEYLLVFFVFMEYTGAKLEKVDRIFHCVPGHEICIAVINRRELC